MLSTQIHRLLLLPPELLQLSPAFTCGTCTSINKLTQDATTIFLLIPDWLGWSKNGYMIWINDYPEHACVLAKFSADSMLLNPTKLWLDAPPQPQHNKNKMQPIVVWNN